MKLLLGLFIFIFASCSTNYHLDKTIKYTKQYKIDKKKKTALKALKHAEKAFMKYDKTGQKLRKLEEAME